MSENTINNSDRNDTSIVNQNSDILINILRVLTMLEGALNRLMRNNFYDRSQYPEEFIIIEALIDNMRGWIKDYNFLSGTENFSYLSMILLSELCEMIIDLINIVTPKNGKKQISKSQKETDKNKLRKKFENMLDKISSEIESLETYDADISQQMEKFVQQSFEKHMEQKIEEKQNHRVSSRGKKTIIFPCSSLNEYKKIISDRKKFKETVLKNLCSTHKTGHQDTCTGEKSYSLAGFRPNNRKVKMKDNIQHEIPIRMGKCEICGERFSFLPSFLPREKHFSIEIIGSVVRNVLLFNSSIRSAFETVKDFCSIKSKQTICNWIKWIGMLHPAELLTRAGVRGSGYLHEDEGFEKEVDLRTYSVVMVEPESMLVWHADYVDHVDEKGLIKSFENFLEQITFKVIGVSKDKWKASTNALKKVIKRIWIGFCHRHCKKNFWDSLAKYKKATNCPDKLVRELYHEFKKILDQSTSKSNLIVRLKALEERKECEHPLLKQRLKELKENAAHYTMHNKRKGISTTTFAVDNYLKIVKRKLRQVESFRDKEMTKLTFQGMATVRNFVPFMSGAKNAHKSPFELAGGETYGLSWIQTMNIHSAFLFTPTA
jgi:histone H3/H4